MPQKNQSNYADSVRAWASSYKDSVLVDMHYDNEIGFKNVYVHKDDAESWKGRQQSQESVATANWQYWMVPTFFAIMVIMIIFASVLYKDNDKALREKRKDSVLGFISKKKD
jgi:hypothetical protein